VIDRKVTPGTLVEAFQPLVTIADLSSLWVFFQVAEKDLALLREGLAVRIRSESYPDEHFAGRVDFVGGEVDAATRTVRVRATVVNRGAKLKPGLFVKGHIEIPRPAKEAGVLAVPQAALQTLEGRPTVFVQTEPGTFVRRFVETGHTFEGFTEVLSGIRRGEIVVTEGSFVLKSEFAKATLADEH
jgi:cobalt-zinc-cadmium efflux system membrane fusion protein